MKVDSNGVKKICSCIIIDLWLTISSISTAQRPAALVSHPPMRSVPQIPGILLLLRKRPLSNRSGRQEFRKIRVHEDHILDGVCHNGSGHHVYSDGCFRKCDCINCAVSYRHGGALFVSASQYQCLCGFFLDMIRFVNRAPLRTFLIQEGVLTCDATFITAP